MTEEQENRRHKPYLTRRAEADLVRIDRLVFWARVSVESDLVHKQIVRIVAVLKRLGVEVRGIVETRSGVLGHWIHATHQHVAQQQLVSTRRVDIAIALGELSKAKETRRIETTAYLGSCVK